MAFMLLIHEPVGQRQTRSRAEGEAVYERMLRFADDLKARGVLRAVESLASQESGTARVKVRNGRAQVVDGPLPKPASRAAARVDATGRPVLLLEQDRARWDHLLIRRGLAALDRAQSLGGALGPYALQAAIAACHARAPTGGETDWPRIAAIYDALAQVAPSPVVELNRAVAVGMAFGAAAGLEIIDALREEKSLRNYHWLPSVRGDLLAKLGRNDEARTEFERAAALATNARERELLSGRIHGLGGG